MLFGVADIHTIEHFRPVARFGSARARVESQNSVASVVFAFKQSAKSYVFDFFFGFGKVFIDFFEYRFVALFFGEFDHHLRVADSLFGFIENVEFVSYLLRFAAYVF